MTNSTHTVEETVSIEQATRFLGHAFRNIDLPPLSSDDMVDIIDGLRCFVRDRASHSTPAGEDVEREERYLIFKKSSLSREELQKLRSFIDHPNGHIVDQPAPVKYETVSSLTEQVEALEYALTQIAEGQDTDYPAADRNGARRHARDALSRRAAIAKAKAQP